jgi:GT2 family glycosyltransferase
MDVSIIVVNYNTKDLLGNCVKSIYKFTHNLEFEIIVVDNASVDGSQEFLKSNFPNVVLIESKTNLGFGKANNLGAEYAKGEFLFLLNSDTILLNNAMFELLDFFRSNKNLNIGCLGGVLLDKEGKNNHSSESFPSKTRILFEYINNYLGSTFKSPYKREKREFTNDNYFEVDYITGADLFLLKDLFLKIGGFDPVFFMYYEESDLQKQISKLGLKQFLIKEPKIIHLEGASVSEAVFSAKKRIMIHDGMFKYFKKNSFIVNYYIFRFVLFIVRLPVLFDKRITYKERIQFFYSLIR